MVFYKFSYNNSITGHDDDIFKILCNIYTNNLHFVDSNKMVLEIEVNADSVKKLEKFLGTGKYKDLAVNTQSFSRKLNEERKMRIPYVDGQVRNAKCCQFV